jgi:hypothetical protein
MDSSYLTHGEDISLGDLLSLNCTVNEDIY